MTGVVKPNRCVPAIVERLEEVVKGSATFAIGGRVVEREEREWGTS